MSAYQYLLHSLSWSKHAETAEFNTSNVPEAISLCVCYYIHNSLLSCDSTGDNSPHLLVDTLENKMDDNLRVNTLLVDKLRSIGPIFPALGNHGTLCVVNTPGFEKSWYAFDIPYFKKS